MVKTVDPVAALKAFVATHQNQRQAAEALGISQAYLSDLMNGRRGMGQKILAKLGLRQVVIKATLVLLAGLLSACSGSPMGPSVPPAPVAHVVEHVWAVSGQSNAKSMMLPLSTYATIIGAAEGNTPITEWAPGRPLWTALEASLRAKPVQVDALVWWQGESGIYGDQRDIDAYPAQLDDVIARFSAIQRPKKIVICGLDGQPGFQFFRAMQQEYAAARGYLFVPSHDLPREDEGWWSPHLTADGYKQMASRVAEALR